METYSAFRMSDEGYARECVAGARWTGGRMFGRERRGERRETDRNIAHCSVRAKLAARAGGGEGDKYGGLLGWAFVTLMPSVRAKRAVRSDATTDTNSASIARRVSQPRRRGSDSSSCTLTRLAAGPCAGALSLQLHALACTHSPFASGSQQTSFPALYIRATTWYASRPSTGLSAIPPRSPASQAPTSPRIQRACAWAPLPAARQDDRGCPLPTTVLPVCATQTSASRRALRA